MNEEMSKVRPEECERRIIFMPSKARLEIFLKNMKRGGPWPPCFSPSPHPPDPLLGAKGQRKKSGVFGTFVKTPIVQCALR